MTRWMLVEDEADLYEMLISLSNSVGIDVIPFADGEQAAAWLKDVQRGIALDKLPTVALLDIRLNGTLQGDDIGALIRQTPALQNMTIVLMTAYTVTEKQRAEIIAKCQADAFYAKPLPRWREFVAQVETLSKKRESVQSAAVNQQETTKTASSAHPAPQSLPTKPVSRHTRKPAGKRPATPHKPTRPKE